MKKQEEWGEDRREEKSKQSWNWGSNWEEPWESNQKEGSWENWEDEGKEHHFIWKSGTTGNDEWGSPISGEVVP